MLIFHGGDDSCISFPFQDCKEYGHTFRNDLKEEILMLMARDKHPPEVGRPSLQALCSSVRSTQHAAEPLPSKGETVVVVEGSKSVHPAIEWSFCFIACV